MQNPVFKLIKIFLKKDKLDILITHFTDPRTYPTEMNTLKIFEDSGFKIMEICVKDINLPEEIDNRFLFIGSRNKRFSYLYLYPVFSVFIFFVGLIKRPKVIFTYDLFSFPPSFISAKLFNIPIIYHIHDLSTGKLGFCGKLVASFERVFLRYSDILSMPNSARIDYYQKIRKLPVKKYVVLNTVLLDEDFNKKTRIKDLIDERKNIKKWLFKSGGIGDDQCAKEAILSLKYLPDDIGLILVGTVEKDFKNELLNLVMKENLMERILILEYIPRDEILGFLKYAFVGLCVYKPIDINNIFASPIKLAEYIAAGIIALINKNKFHNEVNDKIESFVFVDNPYSPKSFADAIMKIYKDKKLYKKLCENAKKAFKEFYHFEYQFEPVMKEIRKWVKK